MMISIDHKFDLNLYTQAFTHKSFDPARNYEILEFYGDSIIAATVVEYLFHRYSLDFNQGELSILKNQIVSTHYLAKFAQYFEFQQFIRMHPTHTKPHLNVLEDCFEAFTAVIALDLSYQNAKDFVYFCIDHLVNYSSLIHHNRNYKDMILHHFQRQNWALPIYEIDTELGNYSKKTFIVNLYRYDQETKQRMMLASGIGKTKKEAEMNASYNAVKLIV